MWITNQDILNGCRKNSSRCPTALAIKRSGKYTKVYVGYKQCFIDGRYYKTPKKITRFITTFDNDLDGGKVKAFQITDPKHWPNMAI